MNLLSKLLGFARSEKAHEEDPVTEILACLLGLDQPFLDAFLGEVDDLSSAPGLTWQGLGQPVVETQVVVPAIGEENGLCRYDLLLRWPESRVQLVVEMKVRAGLTMKARAEGDAIHYDDQLQRYLRVADLKERAFVVGLGIWPSDVNDHVNKHKRFIGCLSWQAIHDAADHRLRSEDNEPGRILIQDFVGLLEDLGMATPKMTLDGLASVYRYNEFYDSFGNLMWQAEQNLRKEGLLDRFEPANDRTWQEDDHHDRIGYRLFVDKERDRFAFIGLWHGEDPIHEDVPDLYFFLEVARGSKAQQLMDAEAPHLQRTVARLNQENVAVKWRYVPDGWQTIQARMSMVELVRAPDPVKVAERFFASCIDALKKHEVLDLYFRAIGQ